MNNKLKILLSLILISSAMITSTTTVFANNLNSTFFGKLNFTSIYYIYFI